MPSKIRYTNVSISRDVRNEKGHFLREKERRSRRPPNAGVYRVHAVKANHNEYVSNLWRAVVWYRAVLRPLTLACTHVIYTAHNADGTRVENLGKKKENYPPFSLRRTFISRSSKVDLRIVPRMTDGEQINAAA